MGVLALAAQPIVVKIVEPKQKGLDDVILGALGLAGVFTLGAVLLAVVMAGLLFWLRTKSKGPDAPHIR
jgi:hypothetical protein